MLYLLVLSSDKHIKIICTKISHPDNRPKPDNVRNLCFPEADAEVCRSDALSVWFVFKKITQRRNYSFKNT